MDAGGPQGGPAAPMAAPSGLQTNMNLPAVRTRAEELRASVDDLVVVLRHAAARLQWEDVLKRFSVINVQVLSLKDQLRAMLKQFVVHPKLVDSADIARVLPIQLSTNALPEMSASEAVAQAAAEAALLQVATRLGRPRESGQLTTAERYEGAVTQIDTFNSLIDSLALSGGVLDPKGVTRREIARNTQLLAQTMSVAQQFQAPAPRVSGSPPAGAAGAPGAAGGGSGAPGGAARGGAGGAGGGVGAKRKAADGPMEPELILYLTGDGLRAPHPKSMRQ